MVVGTTTEPDTDTVIRTHSGNADCADAGVASVPANTPQRPAVMARTAMSFFMFTPPQRIDPARVSTRPYLRSYGRARAPAALRTRRARVP